MVGASQESQGAWKKSRGMKQCPGESVRGEENGKGLLWRRDNFANHERNGKENDINRNLKSGALLKTFHFFNPLQPKVFGVKFRFRENERICSIEIRTFNFLNMPK